MSAGGGRTGGRGGGLLLGLLVLAGTATALDPAPAGAADPEPIEVSPDGTRWASTLEQPLLDPDLRWVPGDTRTVRFHVRHHEPEGGALSVTVRLLSAPARGAVWDDLDLALRIGGGAWHDAVPAAAGAQQVHGWVEVGPGEERVVEVRVEVDPAATGDRTAAADLGVEVALAGPPTGEPGDGATSRRLGTPALLAPGLLAGSAGVSLLLARRPRGRP